ncbi:TcpD family membrane protein [Enterococcus faecalis]|uniref:TcpD family membrane protein n=1 Tax=Enterococcus faecalis TaxID=1351 RepID=UPI001898433D|nr:TcpD family membrane protein [Enterococcus faecalis]
MKEYFVRMTQRVKGFFKSKLGFGFTVAICSLIYATPVFADANAKGASNYILNDWIAPIFGVVVVYLVIKEFMDAKWIQGFAILFFGGIIYAIIKDPEGVLNSLSNLKQYFGI